MYLLVFHMNIEDYLRYFPFRVFSRLPSLNAIVRTVTSVTMVNGGVKVKKDDSNKPIIMSLEINTNLLSETMKDQHWISKKKYPPPQKKAPKSTKTITHISIPKIKVNEHVHKPNQYIKYIWRRLTWVYVNPLHINNGVFYYYWIFIFLEVLYFLAKITWYLLYIYTNIPH